MLDRRVPDGDALDWLAGLPRRRALRTPALMLTARAEVADRVDGFERGADDYLVKPFAFPELVARVRALGAAPPGRDASGSCGPVGSSWTCRATASRSTACC